MICGGRGVEHIGPVVADGRRDSHEDLLRVGSIRVAEEDIEMEVLDEEVIDIGLRSAASPVGIAIDGGGGALREVLLDIRIWKTVCKGYFAADTLFAGTFVLHADILIWWWIARHDSSMETVGKKAKNDSSVARG